MIIWPQFITRQLAGKLIKRLILKQKSSDFCQKKGNRIAILTYSQAMNHLVEYNAIINDMIDAVKHMLPILYLDKRTPLQAANPTLIRPLQTDTV